MNVFAIVMCENRQFSMSSNNSIKQEDKNVDYPSYLCPSSQDDVFVVTAYNMIVFLSICILVSVSGPVMYRNVQ